MIRERLVLKTHVGDTPIRVRAHEYSLATESMLIECEEESEPA